LPDLASGKRIAAYALTEPDAGSDALAGKTVAHLSEDGKTFRLTRGQSHPLAYDKAGCREIPGTRPFFRLSPDIELPESRLDDFPRTEALMDASKRWADDFLESPDAKDLWEALDNREPTVRGRIRNLSRRLHAPGWLQHLIKQESGYRSRL